MVHRNICPENIVLNHQGAWKLFGFDFCVANQSPPDQQVRYKVLICPRKEKQLWMIKRIFFFFLLDFVIIRLYASPKSVTIYEVLFSPYWLLRTTVLLFRWTVGIISPTLMIYVEYKYCIYYTNWFESCLHSWSPHLSIYLIFVRLSIHSHFGPLRNMIPTARPSASPPWTTWLQSMP